MDFKPPSMPSMPSMSAPSMPSNPISDSHQEQIKAEASKFLEHFGKVFMTTYKANLISKVKEDLKGEEPSEFQLLRREAPGPKVCKTGFLTKRGYNIKNWKKRFFVVKTNGNIEYFSAEGDSKPKGTVSISGYTVNDNSSSEKVKDKSHAIVLEPPEESMRTWYLYADSAEEKEEWVAVLKQASNSAEGYTNPDPIKKESFVTAHSSIRRFYGLWQKRPRGNETDVLAKVVYERLYEVVLRDIYRDLADPVAKIAEKTVRGIVSTLTNPAWKSLESVCDKIRPKVEEGLAKAMKPFVETENKIKESIQTNLGEKYINPAVEKVFSPLLSKIAAFLYAPLVEAFKEQVQVTTEKLKSAEGNDAKEQVKYLERYLKINSATKKLPNKNINNWISNVGKILSFLNDIEDVGGIVTKLKGEVDTTIKPTVDLIFPSSIEETMLLAADDTIYTYEVALGQKSKEESANETVAKLSNDLRLQYQQIVTSSLKEFVSGPFNTYVADHAVEIASKLTDMIPEEFHDFVDPAALVSEIIDETLENAISSTVGAAIQQQCEQI